MGRAAGPGQMQLFSGLRWEGCGEGQGWQPTTLTSPQPTDQGVTPGAPITSWVTSRW